MRHIIYYAFSLALVLGLAGCDEAGNPGIGDDMRQIDNILLGLGELEETAAAAGQSAQVATRAAVGGVEYAVNTNEDPTWTQGNNFTTARGGWKLDFHLFNNSTSSVVYGDGSFDKGIYDGAMGSWRPDPYKQLFFPNYFYPRVEAWLYPDTKDASLLENQSDKDDFLAQDLLSRPNSELKPISKTVTLQLQHQRAMIDFKFEDIIRNDIEEGSVRVSVGGADYTPYNVRASGVLEYLLILPGNTSASTGIIVKYKTKGDSFQQPVNYEQKVKLITSGMLGSNNCYCFTLSGKALTISPITVVNWVSGEPVTGEYVAVTAYPTFKGPANSACYFYYDNKLTADGTLDGTPKLQEINFNNYGECTIKPDGRVITHIFKKANPSQEDWDSYKLADPVIVGNSEKMYINLETIINNLP